MTFKDLKGIGLGSEIIITLKKDRREKHTAYITKDPPYTIKGTLWILEEEQDLTVIVKGHNNPFTTIPLLDIEQIKKIIAPRTHPHHEFLEYAMSTSYEHQASLILSDTGEKEHGTRSVTGKIISFNGNTASMCLETDKGVVQFLPDEVDFKKSN